MSKQKQTTTQKSKTTSQTGPYAPTQHLLGDAIAAAGKIPGATSTTPTPQQQWAIQGLNNAAKTNAAYASDQNQLIKNLYNGAGLGVGSDWIKQSFQNASGALNPYLSKDYINPASNPYLHDALANLQNDIYNNTADKFQLAGRGFSGDFANALGRGYANGLIPQLLGQYNTNVNAQQNAAGQLGSLANTSASGMDATALNKLNAAQAAAGQQAALYAPYQAQLAASQANAALPYTNLQAQSNYLLPIAQLGQTGSSTTNSSGTTIQNTPDPSTLQTLAGLGAGGVGILGSTGAFGSGGWLKNAFS